MAVPGGASARTTLRQLLEGGTSTSWLHCPALPDGVRAGEDAPRLPEPPPAGYLDDRTYAVEPATARLLDRCPADATGLSDPEQAVYRARSVDLTMRGGTTSGVVYPLAVCELARHFRVRNVGGASAGAIAAAATAAAELGRSRLSTGGGPGQERPVQPGHVHPGYRGLADIVAWLTQLDGDPHTTDPESEPDSDSEPDEQYRLASLFQPAPATRALWRVVTALLRRRVWAAVPLAAVAFGWRWAAATLVVVAAAVATLGAVLPLGAVGSGLRTAAAAGYLVALLLLITGAVGVLTQLRGVGAARLSAARLLRRPDPQRRLLQVNSASPQPPNRAALAGWLLLVLAGSGGLLFLGVRLPAPGGSLLVAVPVAVTLATVVVVLVGAVALRLLARAREVSYGLLSGATRSPGAGRPLVSWLDDCLSELAGQPGRTLTFADLWFGDRAVDGAQRDLAARDARHRLVNLELVTTDLTQQRAVRFPLPPTSVLVARSGSALHVHHADLVEVLGDVLAARLCPPETAVDTKVERADGTWAPLTVHPLPEPGELPVVFAARLSLAMPGLFSAVRMYRLRYPSAVRDDGGHALFAVGAALRWPPPEQVGSGPVAEAVWFSDGGITSNFPVQLFDSLLPRWPTFGLNLGPYPEGYEHQDVWLPEDWQAGLPPASPVGASALSLVAAVVRTARSWRDTAQTGMPSTRGRVAWVRRRAGEGGTNLYTGRDTIASLALRGALAGARLRQRFAPDDAGVRTRWERHRWLRLRVSVRALDGVRGTMSVSLPSYLPLLEPGAALAAASGPCPDVAKPLYLPGDPSFAPEAATLLQAVGSPFGVAAAAVDSPEPAPELTSTPPL